jgi:hypothetical protein
MDENSQKEEFSYGYIHILASACGYIIHRADRQLDNRGIDLEIIGAELEDGDAPRIAIQTKCTTRKYFYTGKECFKYDLKLENYNKLIKKSIDPTFLIVVLVPEKINELLDIYEEKSETLLNSCAYWVSLQNMDKTNNKEKVRIEIPKDNVLTKEALINIMADASKNRQRLIGM